jgi:hypothetical protein
MTVTTTTFVDNSAQTLPSKSFKITISGELTSANILTAVDTAIKGATYGWTLYDQVNNYVPGSTAATGAAGSGTGNAASPMTLFVYRCLNVDGTTYKYFLLRWDPLKMAFWTSCCENYTAVSGSRVITNESWTSNGSWLQQYDIKDCFIWVSVSPRHIAIWPFIKNEPGLWTGVFEFERVASEDIAAPTYPCFAWTCSAMIGAPQGNLTNIISRTMFAFPRTPDGLTGAAAAQVFAPVTSRGMYPPQYPSGTFTIATDVNLLHLGSYYNMTYGWDTSSAKAVASPIALDAVTKSMPFGRIYAMSVTKPIGSYLDTINMSLDTTGGWASATTGAITSADCAILPMNGGWEGGATPLTYGAQKMAAPVTSIAITSSTRGFGKTIAIGDTIWAAHGEQVAGIGGVYTWAMSSGATQPVRVYPATGSDDPQGVLDIVFDGLRTIYASTYYGLVKIDTETLAATKLTFPNTAGSGLTVTTTAASGPITAATISAAGSGYLGGQTGTLYFSLVPTTGTVYALLSIAVTTGVPAGAITVVFGGAGYTTAGSATATIAMMGSGYLGIDNTYVYASSSRVMIRPSITAVGQTAFTVTSRYDLGGVGQTSSPDTGLEVVVATAFGTPTPLYQGECAFWTTAGTTSSTLLRYGSFTASTGVFVYNRQHPLALTSATLQEYNVTTIYNDPAGSGLWLFSGDLTNGTLYSLSSTLVATATAVTWNTSGTAANVHSSRLPTITAGTSDYLGDLNVVPWKGMFFISPKGRYQTSTYHTRYQISAPMGATIGNPLYLGQATATSILTTTIMGDQMNTVATTGARVYGASGLQLFYSSGGYSFYTSSGNVTGRILIKG